MQFSGSVTGDNCAEAWEHGVRYLLRQGEYSPSVRGPTIECLNFTVVVRRPEAEPRMSRLSPLFLAHERFSDSIRNHPRLTSWREGKNQINQVDEIVQLLRRDPLSRRSVIGVWDPERDLKVENPQGVIGLIFAIRSRRFHLTSLFRTTDAWMANWTLTAMTDLQAEIFTRLKSDEEGSSGLGHVELGSYAQVHSSFHMYLDDVPQARTDLLERRNGG